MNEALLKKSRSHQIKRTLKIVLFRAWAAGAVCFFAAWGRGPAEEAELQGITAAFSLNLIIGLILIMVLCDLIIVNPVIRLVSRKKVINYEKDGWRFALGGPIHVIRVTLLVLLIVQTYYFLNVSFIKINGMDENYIAVPLEPILFGILYGLYYLLFDITINFIKSKLFTKGLT
jgi:hypothetical protein